MKTESILVNVLASNHGYKKIYLYVVRFCQPWEGAQVTIFDLQDQLGKTSDIIVDCLHQVLIDYNLIEKVVAFCGDSANVGYS